MSEGEVEGYWRESDCYGFYALAGGRAGGGRRHVVSVVRALFFAFCFLHLTLQLHFACAYTHTHTHTYIHINLNKYMYIIYTRRILRICNIFENVEYDEFLHSHPKPMLLKYILYI